MDENKFNSYQSGNFLNGNGHNGFNGHNNNNNHNGSFNTQDEEEDLDFKSLFYMVWGYKWIILSIMIVCIGLSYLYTQMRTPIYKSSGTIMVSAPKTTYNFANNGLSSLLTSMYGVGLSSSLSDQLDILQSRKLSKEVADTLMQLHRMKNGKEYPVLYTTYPDDSTMLKDRNVIAARLRGSLSLE